MGGAASPAVARLLVVALLAAGCAAPSYTNPTPNPSHVAWEAERGPESQSLVGVRVTARANQTAEAGPLHFDWVRWDGCDCWQDPGHVTLTRDGFWRIEAMVTVLGTGYGGADASNVLMTVLRDDDPSGFVLFDRIHGREDAANALSATTTDWFAAGERLSLHVTPGQLVEANWPGRSNLSPVLVATWVGD